jgi:hypothetical protein
MHARPSGSLSVAFGREFPKLPSSLRNPQLFIFATWTLLFLGLRWSRLLQCFFSLGSLYDAAEGRPPVTESIANNSNPEEITVEREPASLGTTAAAHMFFSCLYSSKATVEAQTF